MKAFFFIICFVLAIFFGGGRGDICFTPHVLGATQTKQSVTVTSDDPSLNWLSWSEEAFARAKREDKLILLDLTAIWCHACHVMDETTYVDPRVVTLLNSAFIPIRVETDQRPDIEARYKNGGWPTTSILLPSGEIVYQANALTPDELLTALEEAQSLYRDHKHDLLARAAEIWKQVEQAKRARTRAKGTIDLGIVDHMVSIMKHQFDHAFGGFRDAPKFFEPEALSLAFLTYFWKRDDEIKDMAMMTLNQQLKLFDPVWGGFYRYAEHADWSSPHYEKMLLVQAQNILNYLEAYQLTKDDTFRQIAQGTIGYVNRFLTDHDRGGFFASQDADVRRVSDPTVFVAGKDYFQLDDPHRVATGVPFIDRTVYTGWNGVMAKAYLRAFQVLGDPPLRDFALKTLKRLFEQRYVSGKGMAHVVQGGEPKEWGLLQDQVWFADALVEAHMVTGQGIYREWAEKIVKDVINLLEDEQGGGYYDRPPKVSSHGLLKFPYKDLKVNASLVQLFCDLFYATGNSVYQEKAREGLHFLLTRSGPLPVANIALAVHRFLQYPVHIVVVGPEHDPLVETLFDKAMEVYVPGKMVKLLDPNVDTLSLGDVTFPKVKVPQAYVCTDKLCSSPIHQADELEEQVEEVLAGLREPSGSIPLAVTGSS